MAGCAQPDEIQTSPHICAQVSVAFAYIAHLALIHFLWMTTPLLHFFDTKLNTMCISHKLVLPYTHTEDQASWFIISSIILTRTQASLLHFSDTKLKTQTFFCIFPIPKPRCKLSHDDERLETARQPAGQPATHRRRDACGDS
jgi:hypothetical protein